MTQAAIDQAIKLAINHYQAGRFPETESICRQVLIAQPNHPDAFHLLGLIANQAGRGDVAVDLIRRAIAIWPTNSHYGCNLGVVLMSQGKVDEAIVAYQHVLAVQPDFFNALYNLAHALRLKGDFAQAIEAFRRVRELKPDYLRALHDLAGTLAITGQFREANIALYGTDNAAETSIPAASTTPAAQIFAICSIQWGRADLLPHWLDYYSNLGVDRMLVGIYDDIPADVLTEVDACSARWSFTRFRLKWEGPDPDLLHEEQRRSACQLAGASPETWIMHTDLDEFYEFPAPLSQITAAAESQGIKVICGWQLDRVASDGSFPPIRPAPPSLFEQFPIGCRITHRIMRVGLPKVMLARFEIPVCIGHHFTQVYENMPSRIPLGRPEQYTVHHFKWHAESILHQRAALTDPKVSQQWLAETGRVLTWLQENGGKIKLDQCIA